MQAQPAHDRVRDGILDLEDLRGGHIEGLGPDRASVADPEKVDADAQLPRRPLDGALEHGIGAKLFRRRHRVRVRLRVTTDGRQRAHGNGSGAAQAPDDRVRDPQAQRLVARIAAQGLQGKNGERLHGARRRRRRPAAPDEKSRHGGERQRSRDDRCAAASSPQRGSRGRRRDARRAVARVGEIPREITGRLVALLRLLGETAANDPRQRFGRRRTHGREGLRLLFQNRGERLDRGRALEGPAARGHLVEDGPEGELVGAVVDRLSGRLLRRHVADRPENDAGARLLSRGQDLTSVGERRRGFGQAEIENLHETLGGHHDVLGLQVPVNDARCVRLGEAGGDLRADRKRLLRRQRAARQELAETRAVHELHGDPRHAVREAHVVDRDDVGMVQGRGGARLLLEAAQTLFVRGHRLRQDLDGHFPAEAAVPGPIDLAHPTRADRRDDLVGPEPGTGDESHVRQRITGRKPDYTRTP